MLFSFVYSIIIIVSIIDLLLVDSANNYAIEQTNSIVI